MLDALRSILCFDAMRDATRRNGGFTVAEIEHHDFREEEIRAYLRFSMQRGAAEVVPERKTRAGRHVILYRTTTDLPPVLINNGANAGLVRKMLSARLLRRKRDAELAAKQANMWTALRVLRVSDARTLAFHAQTENVRISIDTARLYLLRLFVGGYVADGKDGYFRLLLAKNSGPFPVLAVRGLLFDFNLARAVIRANGLSDGRYVEPYAGGAAVAWELLITGVVRRVSINDVSLPVFAFWNSVLNETDELCRLIHDCPLSMDEWDRQKSVFKRPGEAGQLALGFAFFYLNRTNRSGILNGGAIGGRKQTGNWKIDARFNKPELVARLEKIASLRSRIELTNHDAVEFLNVNAERFSRATLLYIDPPYFEKGRFLYHDAYREGDHAVVAEAVTALTNQRWIVSYDDVRPIHDLYACSPWLQYTLNYSARNVTRGREVMFFSKNLEVPALPHPLCEVARDMSGLQIPPTIGASA